MPAAIEIARRRVVQRVIAAPLRERRQRQHAGHETDDVVELGATRKNDPCAQSCISTNVRTSSPATTSSRQVPRANDHECSAWTAHTAAASGTSVVTS